MSKLWLITLPAEGSYFSINSESGIDLCNEGEREAVVLRAYHGTLKEAKNAAVAALVTEADDFDPASDNIEIDRAIRKKLKAYELKDIPS